MFYFKGHSISTKKVGSNWRHDITDEYKFQDGTIIESASVRTALKLVQHKILESDVPGIYSVLHEKAERFESSFLVDRVRFFTESTHVYSKSFRLFFPNRLYSLSKLKTKHCSENRKQI